MGSGALREALGRPVGELWGALGSPVGPTALRTGGGGDAKKDAFFPYSNAKSSQTLVVNTSRRCTKVP